jgi:hypothetical protein
VESRGDLSQDDRVFCGSAGRAVTVIPGRAKREPGIHNHDREYGFRVCAKRRIPE